MASTGVFRNVFERIRSAKQCYRVTKLIRRAYPVLNLTAGSWARQQYHLAYRHTPGSLTCQATCSSIFVDEPLRYSCTHTIRLMNVYMKSYQVFESHFLIYVLGTTRGRFVLLLIAVFP